MKYSNTNIILILLLTMSLAGCVERPSDPIDEISGLSDQLIPLAVGNEWVFRDVDGYEIRLTVTELRTRRWIDPKTNGNLGNLPTYTLADSSFVPYLATTYLTVQPDGILIGEPLIELDYTKIIDTILKVDYLPKYPKLDTIYGLPHNANTWKTITRYPTPAGIFSDILVNTYTEPVTVDSAGHYYEVINEVWFKRGIGPIKGSLIPRGDLIRYTLK